MGTAREIGQIDHALRMRFQSGNCRISLDKTFSTVDEKLKYILQQTVKQKKKKGYKTLQFFTRIYLGRKQMS